MIAFNQLTSLPKELFNLPIRTLDISGNQFEEFPQGLENCPTLVNLIAGHIEYVLSL
jgi:Leucine-rich repeat (LRR) protein